MRLIRRSRSSRKRTRPGGIWGSACSSQGVCGWTLKFWPLGVMAVTTGVGLGLGFSLDGAGDDVGAGGVVSLATAGRAICSACGPVPGFRLPGASSRCPSA